jgi:hypothetical protein
MLPSTAFVTCSAVSCRAYTGSALTLTLQALSLPPLIAPAYRYAQVQKVFLPGTHACRAFWLPTSQGHLELTSGLLAGSGQHGAVPQHPQPCACCDHGSAVPGCQPVASRRYVASVHACRPPVYIAWSPDEPLPCVCEALFHTVFVCGCHLVQGPPLP